MKYTTKYRAVLSLPDAKPKVVKSNSMQVIKDNLEMWFEDHEINWISHVQLPIVREEPPVTCWSKDGIEITCNFHITDLNK
jgi:hypothetical protein